MGNGQEWGGCSLFSFLPPASCLLPLPTDSDPVYFRSVHYHDPVTPIHRETWDAIVIGSGPAGSATALLLARGGASVLLVEKAPFPREKVCGCCVNQAAAAMLASLGLGDLLPSLCARQVDRFRLHTAGRRSTLALPGGFAVSRGALDQALVNEAVKAGVVFFDSTSAQLRPLAHSNEREVVVMRDGVAQTLRARLVVACTGLAGRVLDDEPGMNITIARHSLMGCAAIAEHFPQAYEPGIIHMAHGRAGYVGLVRLEDHRLDIAAALKPQVVQKLGGPGAAVESLLRENELPSVEVEQALEWRGTPLLTRQRSSVASDRLFVVGDAAGYVEPFTGEGIAWALASASAVAPLALRAIQAWTPTLIAQWNREHRRQLGARQRRCRWLTRAIRAPWVAGLVNRLLSALPLVGRPFVAAINRPWRLAGSEPGVAS